MTCLLCCDTTAKQGSPALVCHTRATKAGQGWDYLCLRHHQAPLQQARLQGAASECCHCTCSRHLPSSDTLSSLRAAGTATAGLTQPCSHLQLIWDWLRRDWVILLGL